MHLLLVSITFVCMCMWVVYYCILGFFCVGLIDFVVNFRCPYQCKWLPGRPSPKWPVLVVLSGTLNLTHSLTHSVRMLAQFVQRSLTSISVQLSSAAFYTPWCRSAGAVVMWSSGESEKPVRRHTARMTMSSRPRCCHTGAESIHSTTESVASSASSGVHCTGKSLILTLPSGQMPARQTPSA